MDCDNVVTSVELWSLAIAFFALGVSIWQALRNKPFLRIAATENQVVFDVVMQVGPFLVISVTNYGTQATIIQSVHIHNFQGICSFLRKRPLEGAIINPGGFGDMLPKKIAPGEVCQVFLNQSYETSWSLLRGKIVAASVYDSWHSKPKWYRIKLGNLLTEIPQQLTESLVDS